MMTSATRNSMQEVGVGGDWAFSRGVYTYNMMPSQGGDPAVFNGKFMTILRRQPDGSWKRRASSGFTGGSGWLSYGPIPWR